MFDMKQFISAIDQIADEKGIPREKIIETIEMAIAAAYKKDYGEKGQIVRAKLDVETGTIDLKQIKYVVEGVDEDGYITGPLPLASWRIEEEDEVKKGQRDSKKEEVDKEEKENQEEDLKIKYNPEKHTLLEEARKTEKKLKVGDELVISLESKTEFGRVAAQTAKQVIIQRLREIERGVIYQEFKNKEGEVVSGTVQRKEGSMVFVDLGRTNGLLIPLEQMPNDYYRIGQRLRFLILRVEESNRGPAVILSRSHPKLVRKLFEFEVPEIESGTVEIKDVAREAGSRSKIAVASNEEGVDPIGSLVGQKGVRVQTVINELSGEKIDIIEWSDDIKKFIANALSPAKILAVKVLNERNQHALVEVADDQFSLAIGKKGQNVRLAAKLTGWKIDVRSPLEKLSAEQAGKPAEQAAAEIDTAQSDKPQETKGIE